ncbi:MAG TPA: adenosylmethionine--8-amino-7-oxononanoate transaminase [Candidatus Deferrimicrobium sp.]|nr:adenosylmethionine--8-amino-7-oxononanoate transaminase [Candidatus Deferrimicrobium sp.]
MDRNTWLRKDLRHSWHPYTQMSALAAEPPVMIDRAEGLFLVDAEGNRYYDAISSWWCNVHGHGHPRIREAAARQMERLDHVLFAGATHEPAVRLASRLAAIAPEGLSRVFFSDNGSTAVEVALKMSLQCWRNLGREERTGFVCLDHGYHGDTTGCMSVSGVEAFLRAFRPILFPARRVPAPYCYRCPAGKTYPECGVSCVDALGAALREGGASVAAVILEPLLLGAGGMIVYPPEYLSRAAGLAREHGVHLILDEVATGFGRTGTMFACGQAGVAPDFLCLSKGLTGGTMPLAATLTTAEVYNSFLGGPDSGKTFYHGHTYTANPVGCAVALASLDLLEEEDLVARVARLAFRLAEGVRDLAGLPLVGDARGIGMVGALELVRDKGTKEPLPGTSPLLREIVREGLRRGLFLRPLGNVVYLFRPQSVTREALDDILDRFSATLHTVLR